MICWAPNAPRANNITPTRSPITTLRRLAKGVGRGVERSFERVPTIAEEAHSSVAALASFAAADELTG